jgi:hypothetical protein
MIDQCADKENYAKGSCSVSQNDTRWIAHFQRQHFLVTGRNFLSLICNLIPSLKMQMCACVTTQTNCHSSSVAVNERIKSEYS